MRRILFSAAALLVLFSCSIHGLTAKCEETHTGNVYAKVNGSVHAKMYTATSNGTEYVLTTDEGIRIAVGSDAAGLVLVVHQITKDEKEAYEWVTGCVARPSICVIPYDIYFLDAAGERRELSHENTVTVSPSKAAQYVLGVSYEGMVTAISHTVTGDSLSFTATDTNGYYVLCEQTASPQTGEASHVFAWCLAAIFSGALLLLSVRQRRTAHNPA